MAKGAIRLVPLIPTNTGIFCHLLEINDTKLVIDCGINDDFDYTIYDACADTIREADCIIVTSFDIRHMGALGYFRDVPAYCSVPTAVLGQIILRDVADKFRNFYGREIHSEISPRQIKFSQPFKVKALDICAYNAGHCVGNAAFRISYGLQFVVVGYNINQRRENYLDGVSTEMLGGAAAFITNSQYSAVPPYTLRGRDDLFQQEINGCPGKIVIAVKFLRLIELLAILPNKRTVIISRSGKIFVDRLKSMLEWAGVRAADIFVNLDIAFEKISEIGGYDIVVVICENLMDGHLGSVLDRCNSPDTVLFLIDHSSKELEPSRLKVYEFSYSIEKRTPAAEVLEETATSATEESGEMDDWFKKGDTIFVADHKGIVLFPHTPRKVYNSVYGEIVNFSKENKVEDVPIKEYQFSTAVEMETSTLIKEGIEPLFQVREFKIHGVSDFKSSKTVLQGLGMENLIIVNDGASNAAFYYASFSAVPNGPRMHLCDVETSVVSSKCISKVMVSEKIPQLHFRLISGRRVSKFIARREGELIDAIGDYNPIMLGEVNLIKLKKALVEKGFHVVAGKNCLTINNKCDVAMEGRLITLKARDQGMLSSVRNIIYKHIAII